MMGQLPSGQTELFYEFNLEAHVPAEHVLRGIDRFVDFESIRAHLEPFYSVIGRPSVDPELTLRMLLVGYCFGIRSERRLCEEVHLNLAYRWFCRLGLEGKVPNHSTFSKNRHGRFRDCELMRFVFEATVERCMDEGLITGEGFAVDASIIKADANAQSGFFGKDGIDWERPGRKNRAVREYLDALDNDAKAIQAEVSSRRSVSLTDPDAGWTSAAGGPAFYAYSTNYLIDVDSGIIVDADVSRPNVAAESQTARDMLERSETRFALKPKRLIGDAGYGSAQMLGWLVDNKGIEPHIPVFDKSQGKAGLYGRTDFIWEPDQVRYRCPGGKFLRHTRYDRRRNATGITKANTIIYRASKRDCDACPLKLGAAQPYRRARLQGRYTRMHASELDAWRRRRPMSNRVRTARR